MPRYIHRSDPNWDKYEIELNGEFQKKIDIMEASEEGWLTRVIREAYDTGLYNTTRPAFTKKVYGRVFIVRARD